jgi:hypothetical protein
MLFLPREHKARPDRSAPGRQCTTSVREQIPYRECLLEFGNLLLREKKKGLSAN